MFECWKCICLNENIHNLIQIPLKFVPMGLIDNAVVFVHVQVRGVNQIWVNFLMQVYVTSKNSNWCWRRNIPALEVNVIPADALGTLCIGYIRQTICIVVPGLIPSTWVKPNPRYESKYKYMYIFVIFNAILSHTFICVEPLPWQQWRLA